mmetsp:Transcript_1708/g.4337  ORF Transcript_1708/g.4337 Transcript_1708/m.4337 type:complete len:207 (-) Transcript_1708:4693-5313(-)
MGPGALSMEMAATSWRPGREAAAACTSDSVALRGSSTVDAPDMCIFQVPLGSEDPGVILRTDTLPPAVSPLALADSRGYIPAYSVKVTRHVRRAPASGGVMGATVAAKPICVSAATRLEGEASAATSAPVVALAPAISVKVPRVTSPWVSVETLTPSAEPEVETVGASTLPRRPLTSTLHQFHPWLAGCEVTRASDPAGTRRLSSC